MTKENIRKNIISQRRDMPGADAAAFSDIICDRVMGLEEYRIANKLLAYMSIGNEVMLDRIIEEAPRQGKKIYIPRVMSKTSMEFYEYDGVLEKGAYGIQEPGNISEDYRFMPEAGDKCLIIIPGVAFDMERHRIGYGGGYYDRYLESLDEKYFYKLAVAYDFQILPSVPHNDKDIRPDNIITETRRI